jgi:hypothetical protein
LADQANDQKKFSEIKNRTARKQESIQHAYLQITLLKELISAIKLPPYVDINIARVHMHPTARRTAHH